MTYGSWPLGSVPFGGELGSAVSVAPLALYHYRQRGREAMWLKQSTAVEVPVGPFVDSADAVTPETGLTITPSDVLLKKNGADWAPKNEATNLVHESNGFYRCLLDATDTNTLGLLKLQIAESGALPVWDGYIVVPANVYDSLVSGSDYLNSETAAMAAGVVTASAIGTDAIDADAIKADAVTKIQTGLSTLTSANVANAVWDEVLTFHNVANSAASYLKLTFNVAGSVTTNLIKYFSLLMRKDAAVAIDFAAELANINADNGSGAGTYDNTTDSVEAAAATAAALPAATATQVLDGADAIETGWTVRKVLRIAFAVLGGKSSGLPTAPVYRAGDDSKVRVTAASDTNGNRTGMTLDGD